MKYLLFILLITTTVQKLISQEIDSNYTSLKNYDYRKIDTLVLNEKKIDGTNINKTINYIKNNCKNKQEIVRFIYIWIQKNIEYNVKNYETNPLLVFKNKTGVCSGITELFKLLSKECGIECNVVNGVVKNGEHIMLHCWNIVKIDNNWYIVEPTWGKYDKEFYFLANPEHIIYTHYPTWGNYIIYNDLRCKSKEELKKIILDESKELCNLQLLKKPITQEYFLSLNNYFPEHFKFENHLNKNIEGVYKYNSIDKNRFYKINGNFVFNTITNFNGYKKGNMVELKNIYLK